MAIEIRLSDPTYGATAGSGDNTTAINAWFAALMGTAGAKGIIDIHAPYASSVTWDFDSRPWGVEIKFERELGRLQYTGSNFGLNLVRSGGSFIGSRSVAGLVIENLEFDCDRPSGVGFQIGRGNGYDVFESCHFIRPRIINNNSTGVSGDITAVAARIVGMNTSQFDVPIFNCKPATNDTTAKGSGVALEICHTICTTFNSASPSNANIAVRYSNLGNSGLGFTHGNTFNSPDFENIEHAIYGDTTNGALGDEKYSGGTADLVGGGYLMSLKNGSGFHGSPIPSAAITYVCPPWIGNATKYINNNVGFDTAGVKMIG
jgi:hypothetical protein